MEPNEIHAGIYQGEPADAGAPVRPAIHTTRHDDERPPQIRIAELFERMQPHRQILQAILEHCDKKPCPFAAVQEMIEGLSANHRSVYSPEGFCDLLERAGALQKVTDKGEPFPAEDPEPRVVVEDGVEYLEPVELPELHYITTDDAKQAISSTDPVSEVEKLFEKDAHYLPVYKLILTMCAEDGGAAMPALDNAIVNDPLVQSPRCYASRFVTFLESAGAVTWQSGWHITETGLEGLEMLHDVPVAGM